MVIYAANEQQEEKCEAKRTHHDLREREQHERGAERAACHPQELSGWGIASASIIITDTVYVVQDQRRTLATPRSTRRMLLKMMAPTSARLIWREMTATLSGARCTKGRNESMYASTRLTTSAFDVVSPPGMGAERGSTRLTVDYSSAR